MDADLLTEVFNEVEALEDSASNKQENGKCGFLEDIVSLEKEISSCKKAPKVKTLQKKNVFEQLDNSNSLHDYKSVIHEGLTDSSEDEDNKYFEESNYNKCGRIFRNLIKQKTSSTLDYLAVPKGEESKLAGEKLKAELERLGGNTSNNNGFLRDSILGMNIINPLISSAGFKEKMLGRVFISPLNVRKFLETPASKQANWVTGGAIVSKYTKTSQKGNQYCIWHLTDLNGDIKIVSLFLFGSAYKEYWKTSVGTVVGILNPVVMENKDKFEATLRVDNAEKILVIGISKDYGLCKSKKKNGENCLSIVNKSKCDYCVYHMKKEYSKACRRSDLQPPKIGRSLDNLRAKVLGKNKVFYGGKTFTGVIGKKSSKQLEKDQQRMKLLSQSPASENEFQKQKDESILEKLNETPKTSPIQNKNLPALPKPECQMIDLAFTISKKERNAAKAHALKYIQQHGPLKKLVDSEKTRRTPEQILSIKRKLEVEMEKQRKKLKGPNDTPKNPLKEKYLKNGITDEFLKLMNCNTRNCDLLKMAESEEREKYFSQLEVKEKIENKMASTFKIECKAVRCLKCNYKAFSASQFCKKEKHPLKVVNAIKRFWKCGNCSARTVCLELVPLHSCKTCGSSKWERASMMPEKRDSNVTKIPLSLRGDEETFLGTATKQANLNLLVPEEVS